MGQMQHVLSSMVMEAKLELSEDISAMLASAMNQEFKQSITPIVLGVVKADNITPSIQSLREVMFSKIKSTVKEVFENCVHVIRSQTNLVISQHTTFEELIKQFSHQQFLFIITSICDAQYILLLRMILIYMLAKEMQASNVLIQEMEKCKDSVFEFVGIQCSQYITPRESEMLKLSKEEVMECIQQLYSYLQKCEKLSGKKLDILRGTINSQGQIFLEGFHKTQVNKLVLLLRQETWNWEGTPVPQEFQETVKQITQQTTLKEPTEETLKYLNVQDELFASSSSLLILMQILLQYIELLGQYSSFINGLDLSGRIVQLLTVYNNEIKELVLGAKAINGPSGLKTITAKHLSFVNCIIRCED